MYRPAYTLNYADNGADRIPMGLGNDHCALLWTNENDMDCMYRGD